MLTENGIVNFMDDLPGGVPDSPSADPQPKIIPDLIDTEEHILEMDRRQTQEFLGRNRVFPDQEGTEESLKKASIS